ncbi:hypothetical protein GCM10009718_21960 [Isoptericola halotolerans]|uniref:Membrane protein YgcG n=1 Tax=Isoptericola halotolerans TaxID=300560 RepID=A0ABX2A9T0_9MICO|nr:DUF5129 domain-containing protein [Isoptericola halotolerans]NOV98870.1 putative membrane protein YgcG [Isoptericola halotolerans]
MSVRRRIITGTAASAVVVGVSIGAYAAQAPRHDAGAIAVVDTAGVLYEPELLDAVEAMRFYEPTVVAFFTHDGGPEARHDDYALNDAVLEHARAARTDWLSENEQKFADDLFIFAVDPEGRLVGTYFGENRTVSEDAQLEIQDAAKDDFRRGQWTAGAIAGAQAAADRMNSPAIRRPAGTAVASVVSLATVVGSGIYVLVGMNRASRSRRARAAGDRAMANVVRDYDETELHTHVIPAESRYGGAMLERFAGFQRGFRELVELGDTARAVPESDYDSRRVLQTLTHYQEKADELDQLDDVIADTAAFLNRDGSWPEVWARQTEPLRDDLAQVEPLLGSTVPKTMRGLAEAQQLRELATRTSVALDRMREELEDRSLSPDSALDRLREMRDELSGHLDALAGAVSREYSKVKAEQQMMERAFRSDGYRPARRSTILGTVDPAWTWFTVSTFQSGFAAGTSKVEQSRSSSSSGGSTSGFSSSSGGSFSGSGSSSRF